MTTKRSTIVFVSASHNGVRKDIVREDIVRL